MKELFVTSKELAGELAERVPEPPVSSMMPFVLSVKGPVVAVTVRSPVVFASKARGPEADPEALMLGPWIKVVPMPVISAFPNNGSEITSTELFVDVHVRGPMLRMAAILLPPETSIEPVEVTVVGKGPPAGAPMPF